MIEAPVSPHRPPGALASRPIPCYLQVPALVMPTCAGVLDVRGGLGRVLLQAADRPRHGRRRDYLFTMAPPKVQTRKSLAQGTCRPFIAWGLPSTLACAVPTALLQGRVQVARVDCLVHKFLF